jgi:hypothetical protein
MSKVTYRVVTAQWWRRWYPSGDSLAMASWSRGSWALVSFPFWAVSAPVTGRRLRRSGASRRIARHMAVWKILFWLLKEDSPIWGPNCRGQSVDRWAVKALGMPDHGPWKFFEFGPINNDKWKDLGWSPLMNSGVYPVSLTISQRWALIILSGKRMELNGEDNWWWKPTRNSELFQSLRYARQEEPQVCVYIHPDGRIPSQSPSCFLVYSFY